MKFSLKKVEIKPKVTPAKFYNQQFSPDEKAVNFNSINKDEDEKNIQSENTLKIEKNIENEETKKINRELKYEKNENNNNVESNLLKLINV